MSTGGIILALAVVLIGVGTILALVFRSRARHGSVQVTTRDIAPVRAASPPTPEAPRPIHPSVQTAEAVPTPLPMTATVPVDEARTAPAPEPFLPSLPPPLVDQSAPPTSGANDETLVDDTSNSALLASLRKQSSQTTDKLTHTDATLDSAPELFLPPLLPEEMNELDLLTSTPQDATIIDDSPLAALKTTPPGTASSKARRRDGQSR